MHPVEDNRASNKQIKHAMKYEPVNKASYPDKDTAICGLGRRPTGTNQVLESCSLSTKWKK